jgi:hypothetical protein
MRVRPSFKTMGLVLVALGLYALHQDVWFFREARPLLFGFLPIGLAYHAAYSLACALLMWLLVAQAWPGHLEDDAERGPRDTPEP